MNNYTINMTNNLENSNNGIYFVAEGSWVPEDDLAVRVVELLHRLGEDEAEPGSEVSGGGINLA